MGGVNDVLSVLAWACSWKRAKANGDSIDYFIDGVLLVSHAVAIPGSMRPIAASDFNAGGGNIIVDWIYLRPPYADAATFHSRVFDAGAPTSWGTFTWTADTPAGTTLALSVRTGNTPTPDGTWTAFVSMPSPGTPITATSRYLQYQAALTSADPAVTTRPEALRVTSPPESSTRPISSRDGE